MQSKILQIVLGQELVEHVGRQNQRRRDGDAHAGKAPGDAPCSQEMADKRQAARLAAERSRADPQKARFRRFESVGLEIANQDFALLAAVLAMESIRSCRKCSGSVKSETLRGRSFAASANSVRAISQCEK